MCANCFMNKVVIWEKREPFARMVVSYFLIFARINYFSLKIQLWKLAKRGWLWYYRINIVHLRRKRAKYLQTKVQIKLCPAILLLPNHIVARLTLHKNIKYVCLSELDAYTQHSNRYIKKARSVLYVV